MLKNYYKAYIVPTAAVNKYKCISPPPRQVLPGPLMILAPTRSLFRECSALVDAHAQSACVAIINRNVSLASVDT